MAAHDESKIGTFDRMKHKVMKAEAVNEAHSEISGASVDERFASLEREQEIDRLLVEIKQPTLVLVGRQDQATPLQRAEEMAADISHSQLVVIDDCGHMAPLEKPAEVSAALRRWLTR